MGPGKNFWDMIGTTGNGLLVVLAVIMMMWAACSSGSDYDPGEITHGEPEAPAIVAGVSP